MGFQVSRAESSQHLLKAATKQLSSIHRDPLEKHGRAGAPATTESAGMDTGSREEMLPEALTPKSLPLMGGGMRRGGGDGEGGCGMKTSAFHLSPPTSRTRRRCGRRGPRSLAGLRGSTREGLPLTRRSHPKIILSLLLQLLRAQVRHGLAPVSVLAATSASLVGRSPPPAPPRPPSPWRHGLPRLPPPPRPGSGGGVGRRRAEPLAAFGCCHSNGKGRPGLSPPGRRGGVA